MKNTLTPWTPMSAGPLQEVFSLQKDIGRLFDEFLRTGLPQQTDIATAGPLFDIEETDTHYVASFDMPGVSKENINIDVRGNQLIVSGERREEKHDEKSRRYNERFYGRYERMLTLPQDVKAEEIDATYKDGVLMIAIPKVEASQPKKIEIKEGGESGFFKKIAARVKGESGKDSKKESNKSQQKDEQSAVH